MSKPVTAEMVAAAEAAGWTYQPQRRGYSSGEAFMRYGTWSYVDERGRAVTGRVRVMRDGEEWAVYTRALRDGKPYADKWRDTRFPGVDLDKALAHGIKALDAQGKRYAAKYGVGNVPD